MHGHSSALSLSTKKNHDKDVQSVYPFIAVILSANSTHSNAEFATVTVTFLELLLADVDER